MPKRKIKHGDHYGTFASWAGLGAPGWPLTLASPVAPCTDTADPVWPWRRCPNEHSNIGIFGYGKGVGGRGGSL